MLTNEQQSIVTERWHHTWARSSDEIAGDIADQFLAVASQQYDDLRRQIKSAIEAERDVTRHYMTQIGRWTEDALRNTR
jgi:hypothetical protein